MLLLALLGGLPAVLLAVALLWRSQLGPLACWVVTTGLVIPAYVIRTLEMPWTVYFSALLRPLVVGLPVALLCQALASRYDGAATAWVFAGEVAAVAVSYGTLAYFFCLSGEQRAAIESRLRVALNWEPVRT